MYFCRNMYVNIDMYRHSGRRHSLAESARHVISRGVLALLPTFALWLVIVAGQPVDALAQAISDEAAPTSMIVEHEGPRPNNAIITNRGWRCPDGMHLAVPAAARPFARRQTPLW